MCHSFLWELSMRITLQMKGQWESNINVWFPFMYSQKWNCAASLFPEQDYNVLPPISWPPNSYTHISVRGLYISRIGLSILLQLNMYVDRYWEYLNCLQTHGCGNWDWGRAFPRKRIHKWVFSMQCRTFCGSLQRSSPWKIAAGQCPISSVNWDLSKVVSLP